MAGQYLDRAAHLRKDPAWFANALADERSRYLPVWNSRNLIGAGDPPRAALLDLAAVPEARRNDNDLILLGRFGDSDVFAYEIESTEPPQLKADTRFEDLRLLASVLPPTEAGLLGYARGMVLWRARHRFCGTCGFATLAARGHVRKLRALLEPMTSWRTGGKRESFRSPALGRELRNSSTSTTDNHKLFEKVHEHLLN